MLPLPRIDCVFRSTKMVKVPHALVGLENVPLRRGLEGGGGYESAPGKHSGQSAARMLVVASCDILQVQLVSWAHEPSCSHCAITAQT